MPLGELQQKIAAFEAKKQDFAILLDSETKRLIKNILDEDLTRFGKKLLSAGQTHLVRQFTEIKNLPSRNLKDSLEYVVVDYLKRAFSTWLAMEDDRLASAVEKICKRLVIKIVDSPLNFSSDLFEIFFETIKTEAPWSVK